MQCTIPALELSYIKRIDEKLKEDRDRYNQLKAINIRYNTRQNQCIIDWVKKKKYIFGSHTNGFISSDEIRKISLKYQSENCSCLSLAKKVISSIGNEEDVFQ